MTSCTCRWCQKRREAFWAFIEASKSAKYSTEIHERKRAYDEARERARKNCPNWNDAA